jgi:hypothetical protein
MIASFFRHLEEQSVEWLLISGQATILYGAATFSEDIDLWVNPTASNFDRFRAALQRSQATYYKLTPPLSVEHAVRHHGFHFVLPRTADQADVFIDVMGCPPRVSSFEAARASARQFETPWGSLPTLGIAELVELKKTQRPRDYPIIGRLVLTRIRELGPPWAASDIEWALGNIYSLPELRRLLLEHPTMGRALPPVGEPIVRAARQLSESGQLDVALEDELEVWFDQRTLPLRRADRHFWRAVIDELGQLRAEGKLVTQGTLV